MIDYARVSVDRTRLQDAQSDHSLLSGGLELRIKSHVGVAEVFAETVLGNGASQDNVFVAFAIQRDGSCAAAMVRSRDHVELFFLFEFAEAIQLRNKVGKVIYGIVRVVGNEKQRGVRVAGCRLRGGAFTMVPIERPSVARVGVSTHALLPINQQLVSHHGVNVNVNVFQDDEAIGFEVEEWYMPLSLVACRFVNTVDN